MKNNKLLFILGIVIIVAGIGIISIPIIRGIRERNAEKAFPSGDDQKLEWIMQQRLEAENNAAAAQEPASSADTGSTNSADTSSSASSDAGADAGSTDITDAPQPDDQTPDTQITDSDTGEEEDDEDDGLLVADLLEEDPVEPEGEPEPELAKARTSGQKVLGFISISDIELDHTIVEGVKDSNIGVAIGHFPDSAEIGKEGNCALAGHNGGYYSRYFKDIKKLKKGASVILTNNLGYQYEYIVYESFVCEPTDVYVVEDLGMKGKYLTMVTCTNGGTQRYIVRAKCTTEPVLMKGVK